MKILSNLCFLVIFILVSPCFAETEMPSELLKIGVSVPLSGDVAEFGVAVKNGIQLAREENRNKLSGISFVFEDNAYSGKHSVSAFRKLRDRDEVDLVFTWGETPSMATAPVAEKTRTPLVAIMTDPTAVKDMRYVIRFLNSYDQYASALQAYLRKQGYKRIAMLFMDIPYYRNSIEALRSGLQDDEELILVDNFNPNDNDFKPSLLKIKKGKFDVLGLYLFPGQISTVYRQAEALRLSIPTFGGDDFESKTLIADTEGRMEGAVYALNIVKEDFQKRYIERFGNDSHIAYAANSYAFSLALLHLEKALGGQYTSEEIMQAVRELPPGDGVTGRYEFRHTPQHGQYFHFPIAVKQIRDGQIHIVSVE